MEKSPGSRRESILKLPTQPQKIDVSATEGWTTWIDDVRRAMAAGEVERVAHLLLCSIGDTPSPEVTDGPTSADVAGMRDMATLPELQGHHSDVWTAMVRESNRYWDGTWPHKDYFYALYVDRYGWEIDT